MTVMAITMTIGMATTKATMFNNEDSENDNQLVVMNMVMAMATATAMTTATPSSNITYDITSSTKHHNSKMESGSWCCDNSC